MVLEIQNTGRTFVDITDPTSQNYEYTYEGTNYPIPVCSYWYNSLTQNLFFCIENTGSSATWKQFNLT